jgi:hypothetical protein
VGFSGAWLKQNFFVDPPTPLHEADPSHFLPEPGDPVQGAWSGPPILADGSYDYLQGESVAYVVDTPGLEMDFTPDDHSEGDGGRNYREWFTEPDDAAAPGDLAQIQASTLAHATDYGAAFKATYADPPFQSADERYLSWRFEGFGPIELPALAGGGQRGLNSYAVNNPPLESYGGRGYRQGWVEQFAVDRKMYDPTRVHDERMITANTATVLEDQPVPDNAGPYNEPFGTFARAFTRPQTPLMRRQPPPMDQSIMTDGTDELYDADSEWVMG